MDPEEISVGKVIREVENIAVVECLRQEGGECCIIGICKLQAALQKATDAFFSELDRLTLQDLISNECELCEKLGI